MELELMDILNRFPELTLEEAVNKLLTEKTRTQLVRPVSERVKEQRQLRTLCRSIAA